MNRSIRIMGWIALAVLLVTVRPALADTACGDAGHYLEGSGRVLLNNPDGRAFSLELHRFQWWIGGGWDQREIPLQVTAPDGSVILKTKALADEKGFQHEFPKGPAGVYRVEVNGLNNLNFWYLTSTLDQSVAWAGSAAGDACHPAETQWFLTNPFVPRRWYFWVPAGTTEFRLIAQNNAWRSQREDHGFTIFSPRGQRVAVLWG